MTTTTSTTAIRAALYARISTTASGQDVGLQLDDLRRVAHQRGWQAVEFTDEGISGSTSNRPGLDALLEAARQGEIDVVAVWKLDRLGRSLQHVLGVLDTFRQAGVAFLSLRDAGLDTTSAQGRLMLQLVGAFAEFERALIVERVNAGIARARANGTRFGRPKVELDLRPAISLARDGHSQREIAKMLGVSRATLRRRLAEADGLAQNPVAATP